jgi:hypothetical protein
MEKYGFVYIWYDRKHKRFYIGAHWGTENDGYVCSSKWMKQAYKTHYNEFRRKILVRIYSTKKDLFEEEYKWLSLIKDEELGKKYYNLHKRNYNVIGFSNTELALIGRRITDSKLLEKHGENWRSILSKKANKALKDRLDSDENFFKEFYEKAKKNQKLAVKAALSDKAKDKRKKTFLDKKHSEGENNSNYGNMWIYNEDLRINKLVANNLVLTDEWKRGRKMIWN